MRQPQFSTCGHTHNASTCVTTIRKGQGGHLSYDLVRNALLPFFKINLVTEI